MGIKELLKIIRNAPRLTQARLVVTPIVIVLAMFEAGIFTSIALALLWLGAEASDWRRYTAP